MSEKFICYMDVLGFSNYVTENDRCDYALDILNNVNLILKTRIVDYEIMKKEGYDTKLDALVKRTSVDSFEDYIALSDSIFIASSNNCDLFVMQISTFLSECYLLRADQYRKPENMEKPECVKVQKYDFKQRKFVPTEYMWYPILFRGGISYGEVAYGENYCLHNGRKPGRTLNLVGKGVVTAVNLEKCGKGPHLYIDDNILKKMSDGIRKFVVKRHDAMYILCPVFHYIWENPYDVVLNDFKMELEASLNLWRAYKKKVYSDQYYELLKLTIESFLKGSEVYYPDKYNVIKEKVKALLKKEDVKLQEVIELCSC